MNKFIPILIIILTIFSVNSSADKSNSNCELKRPIKLSGLNWNSNAFHTEVASYIISKGYGCTVEIVPGNTKTLTDALINGDTDITMEIWSISVGKQWVIAKSEGKVIDLGVNFPDSIQGWFITAYMVRGNNAIAPGLKSVFDIEKYLHLLKKDPKAKKADFYNCVIGWKCEITNERKLIAYKLADKLNNIKFKEAKQFEDAIINDYRNRKPFLTYYWGPTWILGEYDLVMLEEPPYNRIDWFRLESDKTPTRGTAYPTNPVSVSVHGKFAEQAPILVEFLTRYETTNKIVSEALAYMKRNNVNAKEAAIYFLKNHAEIWSEWVPNDIASRINVSLQQ